ncbi:MAG: Clp protease N-terminal domain-containing protein, partial [Bacteroidia bacterium]
MEAKFSPRVKDVITYSREEALRLGHDFIGIEHLMLGMIRDGEGVGIRLLKSLKVDPQELRRSIEQSLTPGLRKSNNLANIPLVKQAEKTLKLTYLEAKTFKANQIGTEHLLLCILKDNDNIVSKTLLKYGVDYDAVRVE